MLLKVGEKMQLLLLMKVILKFDNNYIHISCMLLGGNLFFVKSDLLNLAINFDCSSDCKVLIFFEITIYNKQLLDEVEHDIMNYQSRGLCYLTQTRGFDNS